MRHQHLPFEMTGPHTSRRQLRSRAAWRRVAIIAALYAALYAAMAALTLALT